MLFSLLLLTTLGTYVQSASITVTCVDGQFSCASKTQCVPQAYTCDGEDDCNDGSDEKLDKCKNGVTSDCGITEFQCTRNKNCIPKRWVCDGEQDCDDNSDEGPSCHSSKLPDTCQLPVKEGPCGSSITRYYYNVDWKQCTKFIYSGCGGNDNNFATKRACEYACRVGDPDDVEEEDKGNDGSSCSALPNSGPCFGAFLRWFYNSSSQTCDQFIYGGCLGNRNNYLTKQDCEDGCSDVCRLPAVTGPCKAWFTRYFYDSSRGSCQRFVYGGCLGNKNNFATLAECEQTCSYNRVKTLCDKPGTYRHPKNCSQFILCIDNPELSCPGGYRWDDSANKCDLAWRVSCNTDSTASDFSCTGKARGYHAHPKDCTKYYLCTIDYILSCPDGSVWNSDKDRCDNPAYTECTKDLE